MEEKIPWKCRCLVIGTGTGALPVMKQVKREAKRRNIKLLILPTKQAIQELKQKPDGNQRHPARHLLSHARSANHALSYVKSIPPVVLRP